MSGGQVHDDEREDENKLQLRFNYNALLPFHLLAFSPFRLFAFPPFRLSTLPPYCLSALALTPTCCFSRATAGSAMSNYCPRIMTLAVLNLCPVGRRISNRSIRHLSANTKFSAQLGLTYSRSEAWQ